MNRYLPDVIDQMLIELPLTEEDLRAELGTVKDSACFAAPETMGIHWGRAAMELSAHIPQNYGSMNEWQTKVAKIWLADSGEE